MARTIRPAGSLPSADVVSGEIIRRGRPIRITGDFAPDTVHSVVITGGGSAAFDVDDPRTIVVDTGGLAPGAHTIRIEGRPGERRDPGRQDFQVDIVIVVTAAPLPDDLVAVHASRFRIGELSVQSLRMDADAEGPFIDAFKLIARTGDGAETAAFDHTGGRVDLDAELSALAARRQATYGRIEPALYERLRGGGDVEVAVWAASDDGPLPEKSEKNATRRPGRERVAERAQARALAEKLAEASRAYGLEVIRIDAAAPVVYGRIPADAVSKLAEHELVAAVFASDDSVELDLGNSIAIANSDDVHTLGTTGKGVRVAVYEDGVDDTTNLQIAGQYTTSPALTSHARLTHAVIKNIEKNRPHGHAPDVSLFSANSSDLDAIRWAAQDQGCTVISQSFHRTDEQTSDGLSHDDMYKDWLALRWPYPTIVEAAGNGAASEFVNHKGYNRLTAGSHDDAATAMASDSVFRNPASRHGDRELPEIAANGTGVSAVGLSMSGTSFAAPATAGIAALVQQAAPTLQSWPEGCRAVLMAGAWRNPSGGRWRADIIAGVDGRDGAGAVDAERSVAIAKSRQSRGNPGALRGWDVGTLRSSDLDAAGTSTFRYRITTPRTPILFGQHVKVALAWDSHATRSAFWFGEFLADSLTVDLDLWVRDSAGTLVATSSSWDNSYEIAEFDARAGETYEITIRRWSGSDDVWFGIAWTQISTLFDIFGSANTSPAVG